MTAVSMLELLDAGPVMVVGFGEHEILDHLDLAELREELGHLLDEHGCRSLGIDLTGVKLLPSGLLGLLATIRGMGVDIQIYNACPDIREVLEITQLDRMLDVRSAEV